MPTAMEVYKMLPKKNCGECKFPTCLAFAMQLANKKVALSDCPYVDEKVKATLADSSAPPIRLVKFGGSVGELAIGDETEMFRHDKKFYHQTVLSLRVKDTASEADQKKTIEHAASLTFERVGQKMRLDAVVLQNISGQSGPLEALAKHAMAGCNLPVIILGDKAEAIAPAAKICKDRKPLIGIANKGNLDAMVALAKEIGSPLVISAENVEELSKLASAAKDKGVQDIVLDSTKPSLGQELVDLTVIRRMAIKSSFRPLGHPTLVRSEGNDILAAALAIPKYGSIVVLDDGDVSTIYPLLALRQNIYTDPQVPLQVEEKVYTIGAPKEGSPLLLTTNFSLTYFTVAGDIEKSGIPSWLLVTNTEGLSVMTAFAAGKFTPEGVSKLIEKLQVKQKNNSASIIIPGMVSRMSGKLEELTGMKVVVGPRESEGLPKFLKNLLK
jgi:acetyl-CoA decarbonylase/synthase complex subunit gamma